MGNDLYMQKNLLREEMLVRRKGLKKSRVIESSKQVVEILKSLECFESASLFATYAAFNGEIDPSELNFEKNKQCAFPVAVENSYLKFFLPDGRMKKSSLGVLEPVDGVEINVMDLEIVLVPLVAIDRSGNRLGFGAGYYDNTFSTEKKNKKTLLVGLAHDFQIIESIERDPWDVSLDLVVTEYEAFFCGIQHSVPSIREDY